MRKYLVGAIVLSMLIASCCGDPSEPQTDYEQVIPIARSPAMNKKPG